MRKYFDDIGVTNRPDTWNKDDNRQKQWEEERKEYRAYKLRNGDKFIIDSKRFLEVFSTSNQHHAFIPLTMPYKEVVWYKPSTWFRKFIKVEYKEFK